MAAGWEVRHALARPYWPVLPELLSHQLMPLPVQRPVPVWFGGGSDRPNFGEQANLNVLRRIARLGDG